MIGRRPGVELDVDAVLEQAAATGCALVINASLGRLDVSSDVLYRARELGVTFIVSTDSHHIRDLTRMEWGVLQASRGFVDPARIANTWPKKKFLAWVAKRRKS
jgi:DNA polymerase (family 10)